MKTADKTAFVSEMATLSGAFDKVLPKEVVAIYWSALEPLTIEQLKFAVAAAVRTCKFFPKVAELIELSGARIAQPSPPPDPSLPHRQRERDLFAHERKTRS